MPHYILQKQPHEVSIIVPTYKEVLNIKLLCDQIHHALNDANITYEIIFVDDNSNDGIVDVVDRLVTENNYPLKLIVRTNERGLSSAVLRGFEEARFNTLLVMDADLQHQPKYIPSLLNPIFAGVADFSIGSRHTEGGSIEGWALHRKIISWGATFIARPLIPCTDPMSGFFALTKNTLARAKTLNPMGYKIGLELMVRCKPHNIIEIPIVFQDRTLGESKLNIKTHVYYLLHVSQLYLDSKQHYVFIMFLLLLIFITFLGKRLLLKAPSSGNPISNQNSPLGNAHPSEINLSGGDYREKTNIIHTPTITEIPGKPHTKQD